LQLAAVRNTIFSVLPIFEIVLNPSIVANGKRLYINVMITNESNNKSSFFFLNRNGHGDRFAIIANPTEPLLLLMGCLQRSIPQFHEVLHETSSLAYKAF